MQQLAIDVGDLLQVILQLVVVLDPATDLGQVFWGNDAARGATSAQSDGQIPHRAMALTASTLASRITAGHITLDQRTPQDLGEGWNQAEKLATRNRKEFAKCEFPPTLLIQKGI